MLIEGKKKKWVFLSAAAGAGNVFDGFFFFDHGLGSFACLLDLQSFLSGADGPPARAGRRDSRRRRIAC